MDLNTKFYKNNSISHVQQSTLGTMVSTEGSLAFSTSSTVNIREETNS